MKLIDFPEVKQAIPKPTEFCNSYCDNNIEYLKSLEVEIDREKLKEIVHYIADPYSPGGLPENNGCIHKLVNAICQSKDVIRIGKK